MKLKGMAKNIKETDLQEAAEVVVERIEILEAQVSGKGQGVGKDKQGQGGFDSCICSECGYKTKHERGIACNTISCPECGAKLIGSNDKKDVKENKGESQDIMTFVSLKEADFNKETGEIEVILIEAGTNFKKKRHYSVETVEAAAPIFAGMKMYINHPTEAEEKARPERDLKDWASTITESYADNGKAMGKVSVHDAWLRERLADPVARVHIGLSINTGGLVSYGKVDGQEVQVIEKILPHRKNGPASVDWVTEPGARGRVKGLLESRREDMDMLENVTIAQLRKERPDLVEGIVKDLQESDQGKQKEKELRESKERTAELEKKDKLRTQQGKVEKLLKESKLPEPAKARINRRFETTLYEKEVELKEAVNAEVKLEAEYINKISPKGKINLGEGENKNLKESLGTELDNRFGIKEEKKDKDE